VGGVRNRLKEYIAEQAAAGKKLAMTSTARGTYPKMRSTIAFGKWLGCLCGQSLGHGG
jgi:hypothetical protein